MKFSFRRLIQVIVILILTMLLISACGRNLKFYGSFCGKLVDKESNTPIEGAVVIANWQTLNLTDKNHSDTRPYKVSEVVSDRDGKFCLRGQGFSLFPYQPSIEIFKAGYSNIANPYYPNLFSPSDYDQIDITWTGNNAIIRLKRLSIEERCRNNHYDSYISNEFKESRRLFDAEIEKERKELEVYRCQCYEYRKPTPEQKRLMETMGILPPQNCQ